MQYYSSIDGVPVYDETRSFFYCLVGPDQQPMSYYSSFGGASFFDDTRPFFYYLVGPTIIIPGLIEPPPHRLYRQSLKDKAFLFISMRFSKGKMI